MDEQRFIDIETKLAHQEMIVEELNQVLYQQQKTIDQLEKLVQGLTKKMKELVTDESGLEIRGHEKPPHY
ncbi:MAG: SlyX family protein [Bdellovibrio sp. ArHS]|uniref:SlyX family protein n=1 Tax=Bdellovibrio sp. ArHS TaxID=1569284 RepID=UPI0005831DE7|nr:SlyX family protein [Bdellovibrio sp. ArHS]KHD88555.1 MAG: SlyX family protein [Bdellovibrio sp. ArHS]